MTGLANNDLRVEKLEKQCNTYIYGGGIYEELMLEP